MKRKLGLMFAAVLTLTILWVATTGFAWAGPANATVPSGGGWSARAGVGNQAVFTLGSNPAVIPVGYKYILKKE